VRDKDIQKIGKEERGFKRNQDEKVRESQSLGKKIRKKKHINLQCTYLVQK
jgi:hypothetical protein